MSHRSSERQLHKARRADKRKKIEHLRLRASSILAGIRSDLGGGYIEDLSEVNIDRAKASMQSLEEVIEEHEELQAQVEKLTRLIGE